jgi:hypothetical protein
MDLTHERTHENCSKGRNTLKFEIFGFGLRTLGKAVSVSPEDLVSHGDLGKTPLLLSSFFLQVIYKFSLLPRPSPAKIAARFDLSD